MSTKSFLNVHYGIHYLRVNICKKKTKPNNILKNNRASLGKLYLYNRILFSYQDFILNNFI